MTNTVESIQKKIKSFQKKYYLNVFIKGSILTLSIVFFYFLVATILEHNLWLGSWARFLIFVVFFALVIGCVYKFLGAPLRWIFTKKGLGVEQSARIIGESLPNIKDRLLNLIQLTSTTSSDLGYASIQQKSRELHHLSFDSFIHIAANKKYLRYLFVPIIAIIFILIINQAIITQSAIRLIHFNQQYTPQAPFKFSILNRTLTAYYNEDFTLKLKLNGNALPENVYLIASQRIKMEQNGSGEFSYTFENVQDNFSFQLEGAGYYSGQYEIVVLHRPELIKFNVDLQYPSYLQRKNESLANAGNLEIPEGTLVKWRLNTLNAKKASILFTSGNQIFDFNSSNGQNFSFDKKFTNPDQYQIVLENDQGKNKEKISYQIEVIKDDYPSIVVNNIKDSILYKRVILSGAINDDYGITQLSLYFKIKDENQKDILVRNANISISNNQSQQNFFYNWSLDSLKLRSGEELEYYLKVWDNDGVNGKKSTKSATYNFLVPSEDNLLTDIDKSRKQTEQKLDQTTGKANKLQNQIEEAYQKLKGKQNLDWQDKKMLEDIVEQKKNLDQTIQLAKEQNKMLQQKKDAFTEQDKRIKEKAEQIQKLMNDLLDEETKKLFEELQKLVKENADISQIQKLLDKLNQNTSNLEKELDRMLELFKEVEYETKLDLAIEKLKTQVQEQKSLLEKTELLEKNMISGKHDKENSKNEQEAKSAELANEQEKLNEEFEKTEEKIEELKKLQEELGKDEPLPSKEKSEEIKEEQKKSKESLEQNKPSDAKENQQKALNKLQEMQQKMEGAQNSMDMEMDTENLESLRQIIHGLIKLSFDQENLIKKFADLQQNDPQFNTIAQQQLKLKDDAKVLEDSLLSISKKDPFMGSVVIKEIGNLNGHLDKVTEANKERRRPQASNEMQLSMTSINNLALMLDDHFDLMMQMMAKAKPSTKASKKKGKEPSLSQMQQQLNEKIQQLKNSGKTGRQLSEELAESAAEQERIRRALEEMQEKLKNSGKNPGGGDLDSKMEQTELDLVNKQLTDQLIKRQKEILTRLLETEKSVREQDMDEERKGETAKDYNNEIPKAFEEYLRLKEKEVELLKTIPPRLYPYYKKEVKEYFKRSGN